MGSQAHVLGSSLMPSSISCAQTSRPFFMSTSPPVRLTTMHVLRVGEVAIAASEFAFSGTRLPRRQPSSCVMRNVHSMSLRRPDSDSPLKPPKTTVKGAPMRVHASIAIGSSGIMPM